MHPNIDKTLKLLPFMPLGGLLVSTFVTYALLQHRVDGLEKRIEKASPESVVAELRVVQERLNDIRDDIKDLRKK